MNTDELLLAKLLWPGDPLDPAEKRAHRRHLNAASKCLKESAPAQFWGTDMYLLPKNEEVGLRACLATILSAAELESEELLLLCKAPPVDDYSRAIYARTVEDMQDKVVAECESIAGKINHVKITSRLLDPIHRELDNMTAYVTDSYLVKGRRYIEGLEKKPIEADRERYSAMLMKIAGYFKKFEWSE